jgi:hypothetical protein
MLALKDDNASTRREIDPIATIQVAGTSPSLVYSNVSLVAKISSVCFLPLTSHSIDSRESGDSDSSDDDEWVLRCNALHANHSVPGLPANMSLQGRLLVSCSVEGDTPMWDLGLLRRIRTLAPCRGAGLSLQRVVDHGILYQTRDTKGTISLYDVNHSSFTGGDVDYCSEVTSFQTRSRTFCKAAPCEGSSHLVGLPSENDQIVTVRDWRVPPMDSPVVSMHAALGMNKTIDYAFTRNYGMLTSIAFLKTPSISDNKHIVACGMENGTIYYHDLKMLGKPVDVHNI